MRSSTPSIYEKIEAALRRIRHRSGLRPELGVVLGSGLGNLASAVGDAVTVPYTDIPFFHGTSVEGHAGQLVLGTFHGVPTVFLQGRFHLYEGYPMDEVVFPTRVIAALGIQTLLLTNAAGGINTSYRPGDLMLIEDHINLLGDNPLKGPEHTELGPRFPDLSRAYCPDCREIFHESARKLGIPLFSGVYAAVTGPTYETPAEVRMLRVLGADAVGMSTVPESIAANHLGVRVVGVSSIASMANGMNHRRPTHREVIENARIGSEKLAKLLQSVVPKLQRAPGLTSSPNLEPFFQPHSLSLARASSDQTKAAPTALSLQSLDCT
jgi:purine-nucleoside phosphorylase